MPGEIWYIIYMGIKQCIAFLDYEENVNYLYIPISYSQWIFLLTISSFVNWRALWRSWRCWLCASDKVWILHFDVTSWSQSRAFIDTKIRIFSYSFELNIVAASQTWSCFDHSPLHPLNRFECDQLEVRLVHLYWWINQF